MAIARVFVHKPRSPASMDEAIAATVQEFPSDAPNAAEPKGGSSESEHELERVSACEAPSQGVCRESAEMGDTKEETPLATTAVLPIVPLEIAAAQKRLPEHGALGAAVASECSCPQRLRACAATTALFLACATGKVDPVRELIDAGLDVNCTDYDRRTPLHVAASGACRRPTLRAASSTAWLNLGPTIAGRRVQRATKSWRCTSSSRAQM